MAHATHFLHIASLLCLCPPPSPQGNKRKRVHHLSNLMVQVFLKDSLVAAPAGPPLDVESGAKGLLLVKPLRGITYGLGLNCPTHAE